jgi:hypothetical protein
LPDATLTAPGPPALEPAAPDQTTAAARRRGGRVWPVAVVTIAATLALPILVVVGFLLVPAGEVWRHLAATVLPDYVSATPCC